MTIENETKVEGTNEAPPTVGDTKETNSKMGTETPANDEAGAEEPKSLLGAAAKSEEAEPAVEITPDALGIPEEAREDPFVKEYLNSLSEAGVSPEMGKKLLNLYQQVREKEWNDFIETRKQWEQQTKEALGPEYDKKLVAISDALSKALPEDAFSQFVEVMDATGVGSHPAVVQAFYALAQQSSAPRFINGKPPSPQDRPKSVTEILGYEKGDE